MHIGPLLGSVIVMPLYGLSALGWGVIVQRLARWPEAGPAFTAACGLAAWIFVGGLANDFRMVSAGTLDLLVAIGLLAALPRAARALRRKWPEEKRGGRMVRLLPHALLFAACAFLAATLMPSRLFNPFDDLHTYFTRPLRMLATGTVAGNPFDMLGVDSLGAQAWLHAAVLAHFDIGFVNGADAIFCFALGGLLLIELTQRAAWPAVLGIAALIAVHPQIVNVSAVYSGTLMVLAMVASSMLLLPRQPDTGQPPSTGLLVPAALSTAALIALKSTFIIFAVCYWALFVVARAFAGDRRQVARMAAMLVLATAAALAPWLALHAPLYWKAIGLSGPAGQGSLGPGSPLGYLPELVSNRPIFGASLVAYDLLVVALGAAFVAAAWSLRAGDARRGSAHIAAMATSGAGVLTYLFNGYLFEAETAVRYSAPVLIGALPAAGILLLRDAREGSRRPRAVMLVAVALCALFIGPLVERAQAAIEHRTLVPYTAERYANFTTGALSAAAHEWALRGQEETVEGSTLLAWTSVPFRLDFGRNRILSVSEPGLIDPWLDIPPYATADDIRRLLASWGVDYVIVEHSGFGITPVQEYLSYVNSPYPRYQRIGLRNLAMRRGLLELADQSRIIRRTSRLLVYEVRKPDRAGE